MAYRVIWTEDAENDLAAVWVNSANRPAVSETIHSLERDLRLSPLSLGESRGSSVERIVVCRPIGLSFLVVVDDEKVFVNAVVLIE